MTLPDKILEKYGFKKMMKTRSDKDVGYDAGYTHRLRIHELQYLLYDHNGFVTWERLVYKGDELKRTSAGGSANAYITIPRPIRTDKEMKNLLNAITIGNQKYDIKKNEQRGKSI